MKDFFGKYKILFGVVIGVLVVGGVVWFFYPEKLVDDSAQESGGCLDTPKLEDGAVRMVTKVIDGDTVLIEGGYSVRLLGFDADERGKPCYGAAQERLEELVLGKEAVLEMGGDDLDQWRRYLRYLFVDDVNIGLKMVQEGLAVARASYEGSKYQLEIALAEKDAIENEVGCKWSGQVAEPINRDGNYQWSKLTSELTGLRVVDACSSAQYYGQEVIVEGWVVDGYRSQTNTVFLNFEDAYPNQCFVGVIFSSNLDEFVQSPEKYYSNQMIRIRGEVKKYGGKPQIILKSAEQIERGEEFVNDVPFTPQAPFAEWDNPIFQDGCEEATSLMAVSWARGKGLNEEAAKEEIIAMSDYQKEKFGEYRDTSNYDTMERIIKGYFGYNAVEVKKEIVLEDIIDEIEKGRVVIIPANGQLLGNPYFTPPGPERHMVVIWGYDINSGEFIVNDPGTIRGEKYRYQEEILFNAIRDYPTGYHEPIEKIEKVMIVIGGEL